MKKLTGIFSMIILLSLVLAAFLPTGSAFAAKDPGSSILVIHNNSGGKVNFDLQDGGGVHHTYSLPTGQTTLTLPADTYGFFAGMKCGDRSGQFNLSVSKQLYLTCANGVNTMLAQKTAGRFQSLYCYSIFDIYIHGDHNFIKGTICQSSPAQYFDTIYYTVTDPSFKYYGELPAAYFDSFQVIAPSGDCMPDLGSGYYGMLYIIYDLAHCP